MEAILQKLQNKAVSLLRLDSGFFQSDILNYLGNKKKDHVIATKFTHPIQKIDCQ